ncbi:DUF1749-domain-containing protein [Hypoxylon trugodes]|uniref:DUF1749-domain-containing protein n=1 Tax=Hypoxylon trugodes TaxID=326681 RepID=UPI00218ED081|nr:DUF1749-domain-containing protein [Hypoxylon trugodes]KAI1393762.1 DUF1749-domain-containing protein [Hypoxylon trugodes]
MAPETFTVTVHPLSFPFPVPHSSAYEIGLADAKNALVFIGGLGDGPHTVPYPRAIAKRLEAEPELSYSVFEFRMTSAFSGFGFASLKDDVDEISAFVKYLRGIGKQRIVLMGHSTGSQDCMEYTSPKHHDAAPVEGYILQAPVCDRAAIEDEMGDEDWMNMSLKVTEDLIRSGKIHDRMPPEHVSDAFSNVPMSVWRWNSLTAENGEDNYFDPKRPDSANGPFWQRIDKPLLILHSENDEFVTPDVDKEALITHWKSLCQPGIASDLSGVIPGATHRVEEPESEKWLADTVVKFLQSIK